MNLPKPTPAVFSRLKTALKQNPPRFISSQKGGKPDKLIFSPPAETVPTRRKSVATSTKRFSRIPLA